MTDPIADPLFHYPFPMPAKLRRRWRSRRLVGDAKHHAVVRVRKGRMERGYFDDHMLDGRAIYPPKIFQGVNRHCWKARWTPLSDWMTLPNLSNVKWNRDFTDKSAAACTILLDNVAFIEEAGVAGLYHDIKRGYFSPMRGHRVLSRPNRWAATDWTDVLNGGYQVEVWEGYGTGDEVQPEGDSTVKTFTGLIENCELESHPDHITITARDFTLLLTDQRVFRWNKAREIRSPITFADRKWTEGEESVNGGVRVSSGEATTDEKTGVNWESAAQHSRDAVEWVQIDLPYGHYEEFMIQAEVAGLELYAALYAGDGSVVNDHTPLPTGWVDLGHGNVPGTGIPWVTHVRNFNDDPHRFKLGPPKPGIEGVDGFGMHGDSKLRIYITNLARYRDTDKYYALIKAFYALRFSTDPKKEGAKVNAKHWILVEDAADVIRMVLIWAGFREWYVEDFGWSLHRPLQFGEDKFFMDVIDEILNQGNFVFHMAPPSDHDGSIGVPHFERQKATSGTRPDMIEVRDTDMTEALQVTWDLSNLPNVIRYRGDVDKQGRTLDGDLVRRFMGTYFPPWSHHYVPLDQGTGNWYKLQMEGGSRASTDRDAGLLRQFTQTLGDTSSMGLDSNEECDFACLLAAIQYAIQLCTAEFQIPGFPNIMLNRHISLVEEATGVNSRLWTGSVESDHSLGPNGAWHMKVGGALIDIQDLYLITADLHWARKRMLTHRPPSDHKRRSVPTDAPARDVQAMVPPDATG